MLIMIFDLSKCWLRVIQVFVNLSMGGGLPGSNRLSVCVCYQVFSENSVFAYEAIQQWKEHLLFCKQL